MIWAALIGPVAKVIEKVIDRIEDPNLKATLEAGKDKIQGEITMELMKNEAAINSAASDIVLAEVQGKSWMQRNWRPTMMWMLMLMVFINYIVAPGFQAVGVDIKVDVPDNVWTLLGIGMGGYVIGRSGEKMMKEWANARNTTNSGDNQ